MASLDDQAKCAKQAEKVFEAEKVDFKVNSPEGHISFTSHYNSKLGHCFERLVWCLMAIRSAVYQA